jgi:hypothetical protein
VKVTLTFKQGPKTIAVVKGIEVSSANRSDEDLYRDIITVERAVERLTGLRLHVEASQEHEVKK